MTAVISLSQDMSEGLERQEGEPDQGRAFFLSHDAEVRVCGRKRGEPPRVLASIFSMKKEQGHSLDMGRSQEGEENSRG